MSMLFCVAYSSISAVASLPLSALNCSTYMYVRPSPKMCGSLVLFCCLVLFTLYILCFLTSSPVSFGRLGILYPMPCVSFYPSLLSFCCNLGSPCIPCHTPFFYVPLSISHRSFPLYNISLHARTCSNCSTW